MPVFTGSAHIDTIPRRHGDRTYETVLLRQSYREGGKVKKRTIGNLSKLSPHLRERIRRVLQDKDVDEALDEVLEAIQTLPMGHIGAALSMARKLGMEKMLSPRRCRERDVVMAMAALMATGNGGPKQEMCRGMSGDEPTTAVARLLNLGNVGHNDPYKALDWLAKRQEGFEAALAEKRASSGTMLLYDATSTYFWGRKCPLAERGHSRDRKKGSKQIVVGLVCTKEGEPVSVEVYPGSTHDTKTLAGQVEKARERFGAEKVAFVGDRGMVAESSIDSVLDGDAGWITAMRNNQLARLAREGTFQMSLFDKRGVAEFSDPSRPGERFVACLNPQLREESGRKREDLLRATEADLGRIAAATNRARRPLRGKERILERVCKVKDKYKMAKHFTFEIGEDRMSFRRDRAKIKAEAALDGVYVIRTSLSEKDLDTDEVVAAYKRLSVVERAFRSLKSDDLGLRPIHHWDETRVRAHVFLCMLAYWLEWHLRQALKTLLYVDDDPGGPGSERSSPVDSAKISDKAKRKKGRKKNERGFPVMSLRLLFKKLAMRTLIVYAKKGGSEPVMERPIRLTKLQAEAERLINDYQTP